MNTSHLRRTTLATSTLAAALTLLTVQVPTANAMLPHDPGAGTSAHSTGFEIDQMVTIRKVAAAQYYVDHAAELDLN